MELIQWKDSFSVGESFIDDEHRVLIGLINQLYRNIELQKQPQKIMILISSMIDYSQYHFDDEEELLEGVDYPGIDHQRRAHREFTQKVIEYRDHYERNPDGLIQEMLTFLKQWWTTHVEIEDQAYAVYLRKHSDRSDSEAEEK